MRVRFGLSEASLESFDNWFGLLGFFRCNNWRIEGVTSLEKLIDWGILPYGIAEYTLVERNACVKKWVRKWRQTHGY